MGGYDEGGDDDDIFISGRAVAIYFLGGKLACKNKFTRAVTLTSCLR